MEIMDKVHNYHNLARKNVLPKFLHSTARCCSEIPLSYILIGKYILWNLNTSYASPADAVPNVWPISMYSIVKILQTVHHFLLQFNTNQATRIAKTTMHYQFSFVAQIQQVQPKTSNKLHCTCTNLLMMWTDGSITSLSNVMLPTMLV